MLACTLLLLFPSAIQSDTADWNTVVVKSAQAVVSIRSRIRVPVGRDEAGPFEGSGFVVDGQNGLVATNRHVAGEGVVLDLEIQFFDRSSTSASLVFADPLHDFAFLKFDPKAAPPGLNTIPFDSRTPEIGEEIRMIGNNAGLASTVLNGTISNLETHWDQDPGVAYLQTSIMSSGGSSGSPIVDKDGNAIGMQSAHDERSSYALPAEYLETALQKLRKGILPPRGTIGLRIRKADITEAVAAGGLTQEQAKKMTGDGIVSISMIEGVVPGSPAEFIAKAGDVLLSIDSTLADSTRAVESMLDRSIGRTVNIKIARNGKIDTAAMTVADMAGDRVDQLVLFGGAAFHNITFEIRARADLRRDGVFVSYVEMGSAAEAADLRRDDVILKVGSTTIRDVYDLWDVLLKVEHGEKLILVVRRPSSFDSATRTVSMVSDRIWDPTRFLVRTPAGFIDSPPAKLLTRTESQPAESRPAVVRPPQPVNANEGSKKNR
ncbi:MAG: trypsin-like peptidase domain-containing protein [Planctomycetota bacterium]